MPATAIDVRELVATQMDRARAFYNVDLKHLTEEQATQTVGGCSRSPLAFTQEVTGVNFFAAAVFRGEEPQQKTEAEIAAFQASFDTLEKLRPAFNKSVDQMISGIKSCPAENLDKTVMAPWGAPITVLDLAIVMVQHMFYHDGQLNYFQCSQGDGAFHWMELMPG